MSPRALSLLLLVLALAARGARAEGAWRARLGVEAGGDSNPGREYGLAAQADAMLSALATLEGRLQEGRAWLTGSYDAGARKFLTLATQDTLVQAAQLEGAYLLWRGLEVGVEGRAKDRRGAQRAYTDVSGAGVLRLLPDPRLELRLSLGGHRFLYREFFPYSFSATEGGLTLRYRLDRRHSLSASGSAGGRRYASQARPAPGVAAAQERRREDATFLAGVGYAYRGPFAFQAGYGYFAQLSNSFGETSLRHRLTLGGGVRLPWQLMLFGQLSLQLADYPDGIYLSPDALLIEDDESLNALTLKLSRPLTETLDVELRYGAYLNVLPLNELLYLRQVTSVGVTWRP